MAVIRVVKAQKYKKRVAAYARVSTMQDNQEESYETQVAYYTNHIQSNPQWDFAGIYADRGITGTSAEKRPQFMAMIEAAKNGGIDLILCKSVSRFARNAADAQQYVHDLKAINVEVRFEKEGVSSFDASSDLVFSMMTAVAQEESRSISENVKWSYRKHLEQGVRHVGSNHMMGYDEIDGKLTPNQDAWIVKMIFEEYAAGVAPSVMLKDLQEKGAYRMRTDKPFTWSVLKRILENEAYMGDRKLQKEAPINYLTKKPDRSVKYESRYIYNDHEGIVSTALWQAAADRLAKAKKARENGVHQQTSCHYLYGKLICEKCGEPYKRCNAANAHEKYKSWRCRGRIRGECNNRHVREADVESLILAKYGWDEIDEWAFVEGVEKIVVGNGGLKIIEAQCPEELYVGVGDDDPVTEAVSEVVAVEVPQVALAG